MSEARVVPSFGQESVWDYPLKAQVQPCERRVRVVFNEVTVADTTHALRVVQRGIPPVYYFPPEGVRRDPLAKTQHTSYCGYKGRADYFTLSVGERSAKNVAWCYPDSDPQHTPADYFAFYAHLLDACYVGGERASAPPWTWLGGWVTEDITGPFLLQKAYRDLYGGA